MAINFKRRNKQSDRKRYLVNDYIRLPEVRLIGYEGENLGVVPTTQALALARKEESDLVIISEKAVPPVARIVDFSKFLYDEKKKHASSKSKASKSETKEFVFGPTIGDGDLNVRIERTKEFLQQNNKVKFTVKFSGREMAFPEIGMDKLVRVRNALDEEAKVEEEPKLRGNILSMTFVRK